MIVWRLFSGAVVLFTAGVCIFRGEWSGVMGFSLAGIAVVGWAWADWRRDIFLEQVGADAQFWFRKWKEERELRAMLLQSIKPPVLPGDEWKEGE